MVYSREEFLRVIEEWKGVPYLHAGRTKSAGVDCVNFLIHVYEDLGVLQKDQVKYAPYPPDWHMHQKEERLLSVVKHYCYEIPKAFLMYGDLILMKFGHCFSHGSIYIEDDNVIHAVIRKGVIVSSLKHRYWIKPEKKYFRLLER